MAEQLPDHRLRPPAEGTLEISVLDERDRCGSRASKMIALRFDRHGEVNDRLRRAEQGSSAHRTRQQGGPAEDEPRKERPAERCGENSQLRLAELLAAERDSGDEQRDGEADSGDRTTAGEGCPADRRPHGAAAELGRESPRAAGAANVSKPIPRPMTIGFTPDFDNASHVATPSSA
jgi:hypothetical protein